MVARSAEVIIEILEIPSPKNSCKLVEYWANLPPAAIRAC
jgi:hypothetical protein